MSVISVIIILATFITTAIGMKQNNKKVFSENINVNEVDNQELVFEEDLAVANSEEKENVVNDKIKEKFVEEDLGIVEENNKDDKDNIEKKEPVKQIVLKNKPIPEKSTTSKIANTDTIDSKDPIEIETPKDSILIEPEVQPEIQTQEQIGQAYVGEKAPLYYSTSGTIGDDLSYTGSVYLPHAGINIPTLNKFNYAGLISEQSHIGDYKDNQIVKSNLQTLINTMENIGISYDNIGVTGTDSNHFSNHNYMIAWNFFQWTIDNNFELYPRSWLNEYVLYINLEIKPEMVVYANWDLSMYGQDILLFMCTVVSSTPQTLYDAIYEDLYGNLVFNEETYVEVGDCLVRVSSETSASHYVYHIRQK